ncbi:MAG: hypothetical protein ACFE96_05950 [Candidatus Hermodarchaeota archaeon]
MTERNNENHKEIEDLDSDLTKEAFFSDLGNIEDEIASEAIELVQHALSLIENQFYDDSIEILRQAVGLYAQINKSGEIDALNNKISEVYLLKEKAFRDLELETGKIEITQEETLLIPDEEESYKNADALIVKAIELVNSKQFNEALDNYDNAIKILSNLGKSSEIEKINELIEDCYNRKAELLREQRIRTIEDPATVQQSQESEMSELELKAQKIRAFEEAKRKENEKSNQALELIGRATELKELRQYDEALKILEESVSLFEEINWTNEVNKIKSMITQTEGEKERFQFELQQIKERELQEIQKKKEQETQLIKQATIEQQLKQQTQAEALRKQAEKRQDEEAFQNEITEMINRAEKMAREYDVKMKRAVKKGVLVEECVYPAIIKIYERVKNKVNERGWMDQVVIYNNQINHYKALLEKDKKLREIESQKLQKQKQFDESLKPKEDLSVTKVKIDQLTQLEEQRSREADKIKARDKIEKIVKEAEQQAREYESTFKKAVRSGNLNFDSEYPEIIRIVTEARDNALAKGWKEDAVIYSTHIRKYSDLYEKEKNVRELEEKKDEEQKIYEDFHKVKRVGFDPEKLKQVEAQKLKEYDEKKFQEEINSIVEKVEKMAREYESTFKKAVKSGVLDFDSHYPEIIKIVTEARDNALVIGRQEDASIYSTHIRKYTDLYEKEKKIRELEGKKEEEKKLYQDFRKVKKESFDPEKLKQVETQKLKEFDEKQFQEEINLLVNKAEKMAWEYDVALKKALKDGEMIEESPFSEIIEIYNQIRESVISKGWNDQVLIYTNQIKIYQDKWENDKKLRELELQKLQKQKEYEDSLKLKLEKEMSIEKSQDFETKQQKQMEEKIFQDEIAELVNQAEKLARDYDIAMKKALKEGNLIEESPYLQIIEIYTELRKRLLEKGWMEQALIYTNQIKVYQEKLEMDKNLRELESKKAREQEEFEKAIKAPVLEDSAGKDVEKLKRLEELAKQEGEEDKFTREIDEIVDKAEKIAREYELAIKKGSFEATCPYLEISESYRKVREKVISRGWKDEAEIYSNQIKLYQEKFERDKRLRELEAEKIQKQMAFKEALKTTKEPIKLRLHELEELSSKSSETDEISNLAMDLIDEAEKAVRSYELSIKKDILTYKSPYEQAISNYERASKLFQKIGWTEDAHRLQETIKFYRDKKSKDDNLRAVEQQKVSKQEELIMKQKVQAKLAREAEQELLKMKTQALEAKKRSAREYESKKDQAFKFMDLAKNELKQNNFDKAVSYYKESEEIFAEINWPEGIRMIKESINVIKIKRDRIEREAKLIEAKKKEKLILEAQIQEKISSAKDFHDLQQEERRKKLTAIQEEKEREREISDKALSLLEEGTRLKDQKKFEEAYDKYITGRDMFKKIGWDREVSRINNDLLIILKKEMKQAEKLKAYQKKKVEKKKELEELLKDADEKQKELEKLRKIEKRKQREKIIQKERESANAIIKELKYNEGILALRTIIKKIVNTDLDKLINEINKQIDVLENASQVPIITKMELELDENFDKFKLAYQALDKAQMSLSNNAYMKAITELNEAVFNLSETKIGIKFISTIEDKINSYKNELDIKETPKKAKETLTVETDDIRTKITKRRAERKRRIKEILDQ